MAYENLKDLMTGICDAVRAKEGSSELIPHQELPERIANISGGSEVIKSSTTTYISRPVNKVSDALSSSCTATLNS